MLIDEQFNLTLVLRGWERAYDPNFKNSILIEGGFWMLLERGYSDPFFLGEITIWKKCGHNVLPGQIGLHNPFVTHDIHFYAKKHAYLVLFR